MPDTLIAPDYEYELSVDVGRAFDTPPAMNCVELWAGNSRLIGSTSLAPKPGQFLRTKVCFTANSGDSRVGQPLRIRLLSKDGRTYFDRLKLRRMFVADSGLRKETNDWTELGCVRSALTEGPVFVEILRISGESIRCSGRFPAMATPSIRCVGDSS